MPDGLNKKISKDAMAFYEICESMSWVWTTPSARNGAEGEGKEGEGMFRKFSDEVFAEIQIFCRDSDFWRNDLKFLKISILDKKKTFFKSKNFGLFRK